MRRIPLLLLAALALLVGGCAVRLPGTKQAKVPTVEVFTTEAKARCAAAQATAREAGALNADGTLVSHPAGDQSGLVQGLIALRLGLLQVRDLTPPSGRKTAVRAFTDGGIAYLDQLVEASRAFARGDPAGEKLARDKAADLRTRAAAAAAVVSLEPCLA